MDDIRDSFSKFKKDIKHRMRGKKQKPDRTGVNTAETVGSSGSLLRPDSLIAASGDGGGGSRGGLEVGSRDQSPQPEPGPAGDQDRQAQKRETNVDEKEVGQMHSPPTPSIPSDGKPDSA